MRSKNPNSGELPFGGKVVVLGGDFRQILPVVNKGSRQDIILAAVNLSYLWKFCKILTLTENMHLRTHSSNININEITEFAEWILGIGNGSSIADDIGDEDVGIPDDLLIDQHVNPLLHLVNFAYPDLLKNMADYKFF